MGIEIQSESDVENELMLAFMDLYRELHNFDGPLVTIAEADGHSRAVRFEQPEVQMQYQMFLQGMGYGMSVAQVLG